MKDKFIFYILWVIIFLSICMFSKNIKQNFTIVFEKNKLCSDINL